MIVRISKIGVSPNFREIEGDGGYFSMKNLNKTEGQYYQDIEISNMQCLKVKQQLEKNYKINQLKELIHNPKTGMIEKAVCYFKQMLISFL